MEYNIYFDMRKTNYDGGVVLYTYRKLFDCKKYISKGILFCVVLFFFWEMVSVPVHAEENKSGIIGFQYFFEREKDTYSFSESDTYFMLPAEGSDYGSFSIRGNYKAVDHVNGYQAFEVNDGNLTLTFHVKDTLFNKSEDEWHVVEDKDKKVDKYDLGSAIKNGALILETSSDGINWVVAESYTDIPNDKFVDDFYVTQNIQ